MIKAVCFDLDGVLVDACDLHKKALEKAMLATVGFKISEEDHKTRFNGLPTTKKLELLLIDKYRALLINDVKQAITIYMIENNIKIDQTKIDLFDYLKNNNIKIGVVTNCSMETAQLMLFNIGIKYNAYDLVSNEDVVTPKPSPEGYLLSFENLGVLPKEVIIVEDSKHGIAAAKESNAHVLVVKNATEVTVETIKKAIEDVNNIS